MASPHARGAEAARAQRVVYATTALDYLAVGMMRTLLPSYARALGGSGTTVGALEALYGAGQIGGGWVLGRWSDEHGRRGALLASCAGSAVGYACAGLSTLGGGSLLLLLLSRLPVGLAKQTTTIGRAVLADTTPAAAAAAGGAGGAAGRAGRDGRSRPAGLDAAASERAAAMLRLYAAMAVGYIVGPGLGGALADSRWAAGWPALPALLAAGVFALVLGPTVWLGLPETRPPGSRAARHAGAPAPAGADGGAGGGGGGDEGGGGGGSVLRAHPRLRALILATCGPECAFVAFTSTVLPALGGAHGWSRSRLGLYNSAWGAAALGTAAVGLPWARLSVRAQLLAGYAALAAAHFALCAWPRAEAVAWACLAPLSVAVAVLRSAPAARLSLAAPARAQGEALGALDSAHALCRVCAPLAAGLALDGAGLRAGLALGGALAGAGALAIWLERAPAADGSDGSAPAAAGGTAAGGGSGSYAQTTPSQWPQQHAAWQPGKAKAH